MDQANLYAKVRRLLALSGSSNPHEAELAARRAQEMIEKYRLSAIMDNFKEGKEEKAEKIEISDIVELFRRETSWKRSLISAICTANSGKLFIKETREGTEWRVISAPSDFIVISTLYGSLVFVIEGISKTQAGKGKVWINSFKVGMVDGIAEQLKKVAIEATSTLRKENEGNAFALQCVDKLVEIKERKRIDVNAFCRSQGFRQITSTKTSSNIDPEAHKKGFNIGKSLDIK